MALGAISGRLAGWAACGVTVGVVKGSDAGDEPTGWALVRELVREFVDQRCRSGPGLVRYLRCDGCGWVTPHSHDRYFVTVLPSGGLSATPRAAVCDFCEHVQPRTVGDEVPMDATVTCAGRRGRGFGWGAAGVRAGARSPLRWLRRGNGAGGVRRGGSATVPPDDTSGLIRETGSSRHAVSHRARRWPGPWCRSCSSRCAGRG